MEPERFVFSYSPYRLVFKEPGGTSRGVLTEKPTYYIRIRDAGCPGRVGFGEVPVFPGLSAETGPEVEQRLDELAGFCTIDELKDAKSLSSLAFGIEQAFAMMGSDCEGYIFPSPFTKGQTAITINGLIWMGTYARMLERTDEKLKAGFGCIKIKIGAINWEDELSLIRHIRETAGDCVTVRVDANGAFSPNDCIWRLEELAALGVHSIEQPIPHGDLRAMAWICRHSPIPVALDEELIGLEPGIERDRLLETVRPQYLILKPALCHGFSGALDWIERASGRGIGWWITSALESSVGLDAIAQFTGSLHPELPQGLGTGALFTNNFPSPLSLRGDKLHFEGPAGIYISALEQLEWIGE